MRLSFLASFSKRTLLGCFHQTCFHFFCLLSLFQCVFFQYAIGLERDPLKEKKNLHNYLFHYETLRKSDLTVSVRQQRDVDTGHVAIRTYVNFFTLGRNFNLVLKPGSSVLAPGLRAYTVDRHGKQTPLSIDPGTFLTGHVQENKSIPVDAHYEDGILCVTVHFPNETYFTETSWRHLPRSSEHDLISYRLSDVKWSFRGYLLPPLQLVDQPLFSNSSSRVNGQYSTFSKGKHRREASGGKKTCPLRLVGDYRFYSLYCKRVAEIAVQVMLNSVRFANKIYQSTKWNLPDGLGWGFVVKEVLVHTDFSTGPKCGVLSYNYFQRWRAATMLETFSLDSKITKFCLAHLFTSYSFKMDNGAIGIAYVGTAIKAGGICSEARVTESCRLNLYPRTGLTTVVDNSREFLPVFQIQSTFTHELGHNWGSPHDLSDLCAPSDEKGGKYIMYPYVSAGNHPHNILFSSCSIDAISSLLAAISGDCFTDEIKRLEEASHCGNGIVDETEDCDASVMGLIGRDPCCSKACTFRENAVCSDFTSACCRNCTMAPAGAVCRIQSRDRCLQAATCDGVSLTCPPAVAEVDGTPCVYGGTCKGGACISYCEPLGRRRKLTYKACTCQQNATAACKRCCMEVFKNNTNGACLPTNLTLEAGQRCYNGECNEKGQCIPIEDYFLIKLSNFFHNLDFNYLAELMRTNIVGTVMGLSALIWILASCYISYVDRRNLQRRKERIAKLQEMRKACNVASSSYVGPDQNPDKKLHERAQSATKEDSGHYYESGVDI